MPSPTRSPSPSPPAEPAVSVSAKPLNRWEESKLLPFRPDHPIHINEIFVSFQGEGPSLGRPSTFLRLAGCDLHCTWCTVPGTRILLPDFSWARVETLEEGDTVLGWTEPSGGQHGRLAPSVVTHTSRRTAPLVTVNDDLTCSSDTRVWLGRNRNPTARQGWREIERCLNLKATFLASPSDTPETAEYQQGYLAGIADGDGCFWTLRKKGQTYRRFRLAVNDTALLARAQAFAAAAGFTLRPGTHTHNGFLGPGQMPCLWLTESEPAARFEAWLKEDGGKDWAWGYLAGIYDAEGSSNIGSIRIAQHIDRDKGAAVYERAYYSAIACGFSVVREPRGIRLLTSDGGFWRFFIGARPAKQRALVNAGTRSPYSTREITSVVPRGSGEVISLKTSTGNYIAEGWLLHNCDTPDTWQPAVLRSIRTTIGQVLDDVLSREPHRLVITGGEPMLQQLRLVPLLSELRKRSRKPHGFPYFVEVETNGTHFPNRGMLQLVDRFNVSPKLPSSGNPASAINPATLNQFLDYPGKSIFKFVVTGPDDIFWIEAVCRDANLPSSLVWLMPEGVSSDKVVAGLRSLAAVALAHSWNLTPRLQTLIWNAERGR